MPQYVTLGALTSEANHADARGHSGNRRIKGRRGRCCDQVSELVAFTGLMKSQWTEFGSAVLLLFPRISAQRNALRSRSLLSEVMRHSISGDRRRVLRKATSVLNLTQQLDRLLPP